MALLLSVGSAWASGPGLLQGDNGTRGTINDFDGIKLAPDSRGSTGTAYNFGTIPRNQFTGAAGDTASGTTSRLPRPSHSAMPPPSVTPLVPLLPSGDSMNRQSHSGDGHGRDGAGR
ncbi:MAG: hypothetical protein KGO52_14160 [Nitrospirota bacterium]|nr:hypothetical protein [Nitrospirota bacterium]MDE3224309.1 hypothetical protein [Nitrospirota bacterium]MDE3243855.1 hypothetical protein [Nitrospirota bacterium]